MPQKAKPTKNPGSASSNGHGQQPQIDESVAQYKLVIAPSDIHRWGVYAGEQIPAKKKVIEYTGERCNRKETKIRAEREFNYMFTLDPYWALDGTVGGSGAEFINHSCDPNIRAWIVRGHILYMSVRPIRKGEELTVDYHFAKNVEKVACSCGSRKCRGTINVKD